MTSICASPGFRVILPVKNLVLRHKQCQAWLFAELQSEEPNLLGSDVRELAVLYTGGQNGERSFWCHNGTGRTRICLRMLKLLCKTKENGGNKRIVEIQKCCTSNSHFSMCVFVYVCE